VKEPTRGEERRRGARRGDERRREATITDEKHHTKGFYKLESSLFHQLVPGT